MVDNKITNFHDFDDIFYKTQGSGLYKNILTEIEKPLFEWVLKKTDGNQIKAAKILGINRNTFRTKLRQLRINLRMYK
ncbi:MAG: helix-turn-helix domain-containing protein [Patescibacteria group bacterium]